MAGPAVAGRRRRDCVRVTQRLQWGVWAALGLVLALITGAFVSSLLKAPVRQTPRVLSQVRDFALTNQLGERVTLADVRGRVWVADIIFTRCAGPCPRMTAQMSELQAALPADAPVRLITLTTDPEYDTPAVLRQYAQRFGADPGRWLFLTGSKAEIARLAVDDLKLVAVETEPAGRQDPADLFIHSTTFLVVDRQGRLRASFESTEPGFKERVLALVTELLRED